MRKTPRSLPLRAFNALCATVLIGSVVYLLVAGFQVLATSVLVCSVVGVATPVVFSAHGLLEALMGVFEALTDGVMAILEAIASIFSGLFG